MSKPKLTTLSAARDVTKLTGCVLIPLNGKVPVHCNWTTRAYPGAARTIELCQQKGLNVGVRLPAGVVVFDVDERNGGNQGWDDLTMEYGIDESALPCTITGSGGRHYWMRKPCDVRIVSKLKEFPGVDFKSVGGQVVAPGSVHPDTGKLYAWNSAAPSIEEAPQIPSAVLRAIVRPDASAASTASGGELTAEQAAKALKRLDPTDFRDHDRWLRLMMGMHHATLGEARQEWIDWCISDEKYAHDAEQIGRRWDSLHADKGMAQVTIGTLRHFLAEAHALDVLPADVEQARADFEDADDADFETGDEPEPLAAWQWIADSMQYVHDDGLQRLNDRQFKMLNGHLCPKGNVITHLEQGKIAIRKYHRQVYIPKGAAVMQHEGETVFNIWRPSAMVPKPGDHQWFLDHVAHLFPDVASQRHLLDFMAQLIQHPEVKINFALLIQSGQGVGKGALAMILRRIIGKRNCVEPSNDEVTKAWTGWQEGAQLAIINELMASGRADVLNRLKSPITEDTLRIEKKFGNAFDIPNHMNFFSMTNHKDALPIDEDDRRWLILFSTAKERSPEYYTELFRNIADEAKVAAVMDYLMHHSITFNPKAPAPLTSAKHEMGERARTDVEAELQMLLDERREPFDQPLVRFSSVVAAIKERRPHERHMHAAALKFLDRIGAKKLRRYTKGKDGLPAFQLYVLRDQGKWDAMEPVNVMRLYVAQAAVEDDDLD